MADREGVVARVIGWCAEHPVVTTLLSAVVAVGAVLAIRDMPVDAIPDLSDRQVIVFTEWMGRSPDLVEDQITYPLTTALLGTPKVRAVRAQSMFGMSFVYVIFEDGTDLYWARSRVLEKLEQLSGAFPEGVRPRLGPDATGVGWVYQYALVDHSGQHTLGELRAYHDFSLRYALQGLEDVAEVATVGGYETQYDVTVLPEAMRRSGVGIADLARAIRGANRDVGGGSIEIAGREMVVRGRGYLSSPEEVGDVLVVTRGDAGVPVRVRDVARVTIGAKARRGVGELDGLGEAVGGIVVARDGANAMEVIDRVKQTLARLESSLPDGVEIVTVYDRSALISRAVDTLRGALTEELIVVALVIFLFLLHFRSSLVPIVILPLSVAAAFIPMYLLGLSSNIMSLGGIAIAIGAMVDATIVIVENAHKRLEHAPPDADRRQVLIDSAKEVGPPIFFSLLIIMVSFLPIFGLTGQGGRLFRPLAYTKTFAMLSAAIFAVTLGPALLRWFVRGRIRPEHEHPISRILIGAYKPFVHVALRNPKTTLLIGAFAVLSVLPIIGKIGNEFMPPLDEGDLLYMPTTAPGISIEEAARSLSTQDRVLRSFPEVMTVYGKVGRADTATDPAPLDMIEAVVQLRPRDEWRMVHEERWWSGWAPGFLEPMLGIPWPDQRRITADELINEMADAVRMPGWTAALTMPVKTRIDMLTTGVRTPVGIKVLGDDLATIERVGLEIEHALGAVRGTRSVFAERSTNGYYIDVVPRNEALARYGLSAGDVLDVVESTVGGATVTTILDGRRRYGLTLRYPRDRRLSIEALERILVPVRGGGAGMPAPSMGASDGGGVTGDARDRLIESTLGGPLYAQAGMGTQGGGSGMPNVGTQLPPAAGQSGGAGMSGGAGTSGGAGMSGGAGTSGGAGMSGGAGPSRAAGMGAAPGAGSAILPGAFRGAGAPIASQGLLQVPLGELAEIRVTSGPPMIKNEAGRLAGYVFVDVDLALRDLGSYVEEAQQRVQESVSVPAGYELVWTGQYQQMQETRDRMVLLLPLTLLLIIALLWIHLRNPVEVLIVLLSVPFALIGSVWTLYLLDYRLSTAVWVGIIALIGLASQTGVVMVMYLDHAYERRLREGRIRSLDDIIAAHEEGTVQRVRPKVMTVMTAMIGLVPLLWADGTGADVMKRIAAPMVGGLITSLFLTLELLPVVYTYWRYAQLRFARRAEEKRNQS